MRHLKVVGTDGLAALHQRKLCRGTAHIEGEHAIQVRQAREVRGAEGSGGRAGFDNLDRELAREGKRIDPATGLHHHDLAAKTLVAQALLKFGQIAHRHGLGIGVDRCRCRAFVLLQFRQDIARQGDGNAGRHLLNDLAHAPLVGGVAV